MHVPISIYTSDSINHTVVNFHAVLTAVIDGAAVQGLPEGAVGVLGRRVTLLRLVHDDDLLPVRALHQQTARRVLVVYVALRVLGARTVHTADGAWRGGTETGKDSSVLFSCSLLGLLRNEWTAVALCTTNP